MQSGNSASQKRSHRAGPGAWIANTALICASVCLILTFICCGGGGSNGQGPPPPSPSFTIIATPTTPSIVPGTSSTFQVSVTPSNGFSGTVAIAISGLPSGLTASPSSFSVQNTPQTVTLTADSTIANGNYSVTLKGTSGT